MKMTCRLKIRSFIQAVALSAGLSFVFPAFGQLTNSWIMGPNGEGLAQLGTLGGHDTVANGINDAGQVVGTSKTIEGDYHAFITGPNGVSMTDLGTLGGRTSIAFGINAAGRVVGHSSTSGGDTHAFITGPNGRRHD
ncbi:probable extracellular repeat, HAF family [Nitrosospira sp. Nl5]|uniref:hypothetical protein n=1 Tax=Nitrosospira sp. Nl5 TaxID=200120 RepID=UPI00088E3A35|nr:hypothetical protein [Nitrosospira sp. Nl5]SCY31597.1 probable extracellular repeat, HAF family [Nitrosospira sp. Nl5]